MAYTVAELSGPVQFGDDKKLFFYDAQDASDSISTVAADGYFNNSDDNIRFAVEDQIMVKTAAGNFELAVTASTGGAVTTYLLPSGDTPVETASTSVSLSAYGVSVCGVATGAQRIYRLPAPTRAGQKKLLVCTTSTDHTITSTSGYSIGTTGGTAVNIVGLATSVARFVELTALSTTQYVISAMSSPSSGIITTT